MSGDRSPASGPHYSILELASLRTDEAWSAHSRLGDTTAETNHESHHQYAPQPGTLHGGPAQNRHSISDSQYVHQQSERPSYALPGVTAHVPAQSARYPNANTPFDFSAASLHGYPATQGRGQSLGWTLPSPSAAYPLQGGRPFFGVSESYQSDSRDDSSPQYSYQSTSQPLRPRQQEEPRLESLSWPPRPHLLPTTVGVAAIPSPVSPATQQPDVLSPLKVPRMSISDLVHKSSNDELRPPILPPPATQPQPQRPPQQQQQQKPQQQSPAAHISTCHPPSSPPAHPQRKHTLTIRQQPRGARACGFGERDRRVVDPPPILHLAMTDPTLSASELEHALSSPNFVIHCTLRAADGISSRAEMPPEYSHCRAQASFRLTGSLAVSPFVGTDEHGVRGTFFPFADLSVRTPGVFTLFFSLHQITPGRSAPRLAEIVSEPFTVYHAKEFPGMQASTPLTTTLRLQGCHLGIKQGTEKRMGGRARRAANNNDNGGGGAASGSKGGQDDGSDGDEGRGSNKRQKVTEK